MTTPEQLCPVTEHGPHERYCVCEELRKAVAEERKRCANVVKSPSLRMGSGCSPECHDAMYEKIMGLIPDKNDRED